MFDEHARQERAESQSHTKAGAQQAERSRARHAVKRLGKRRRPACQCRRCGDSLSRAQHIEPGMLGAQAMTMEMITKASTPLANTRLRPKVSANAPAVIRRLPKLNMNALVIQFSASGLPRDRDRSWGWRQSRQ